MPNEKILSEIENDRMFQTQNIIKNTEINEVFNTSSIGESYMKFEILKEDKKVLERKEKLNKPRKLEAFN